MPPVKPIFHRKLRSPWVTTHTQCEGKDDKQHEIDMPNMNPKANVTQCNHIHHGVGVCVGLVGVGVGSARLFGYQHVGISNMKCSCVSPTCFVFSVVFFNFQRLLQVTSDLPEVQTF